jgi:hypothetical protein
VPLRAIASALLCQDQDGDGHGVDCALGADCNDSEASVFAGAAESCDGIDQDCDGRHDEDFVGLGTACEVGFGACTAVGTKICGADRQSLRCSVNPVTGGSELCNEIDDDCDGATDEDFASHAKLCSVGVGAAAPSTSSCSMTARLVCNSTAPPGKRSAATASTTTVTASPTRRFEVRDLADNDCDGDRRVRL